MIKIMQIVQNDELYIGNYDKLTIKRIIDKIIIQTNGCANDALI